ncbi:FAD-binding protein [Embleya sp. NPDC001921]
MTAVPIRTDDAAKDAATGDFGGIIRHRPAAVVEVTDPDQIPAAVRLAAERGWRIAVQGQRHSTHGQAQAPDGLALSTTGLDHVRVDAGSREVDVGAGTRWDTLTRHTLRHGLIPPVLTDFLGLSVGGTLSMGGIGGSSFRAGSQTDNVNELTVVTGTGQTLACSGEHNRDLFDATRAGLGRFGVIASARLPLVPAPNAIYTCKALYTDISHMIDDQRRLTARNGVGFVQGFAVPNSGPLLRRRFGTETTHRVPSSKAQPWLYQIKIAIPWNDRGSDRAVRDSLDGLAVTPDRWTVETRRTFEFADRMAAEIRVMRGLGLWQAPHPYLSVFLPADRAPHLINTFLGIRTPTEQHHGPITIQVLADRALRTPNLRLPFGEHHVLLSLLPNTHPPTSARTQSLLTGNRLIYDATRRAGGTLYPFGSLPMTDADERRHLGPLLPQHRAAKERYDPYRVFGGPDFGPRR